MSAESSRRLVESTFSYRSANNAPGGVAPRFTRKSRRALAASRRPPHHGFQNVGRCAIPDPKFCSMSVRLLSIRNSFIAFYDKLPLT